MVCKIILGTAQFGLDYGINNKTGKPSEDQVSEILDYASLQGINILDTADAYGNAQAILCNYFDAHSHQFLINTKFRKGILSLQEQLHNTQKSLGTIQIDTYFFHSYHDFVEDPSLIEELKALKLEGRINKIGLSVYENPEFLSAIENNDIDVIQLPFNLLDNFSQRGQLLKKAKTFGKEIHTRSVFLQGLFFKNLDELPSKFNALKPQLMRIQDIAKENNIRLEHLALAYTLKQKHIDKVIIGIDNISQLESNLVFTKGILSNEIIEEIDKIYIDDNFMLYPKNWGV